MFAMETGRKKRMPYFLFPVVAASLLLGCAASPPAKVPVATAPGVQISPESRADFDAAMKLMKSEEYEKGIELLNGVVSKSQNSAIPYINLAIAQMKLGRLKEAEANLKTALGIEPGNPVSHNEFGVLYRKTGRFNEAQQLYENILKKYPNYPLAHKNLGILCDLYLRDYECALREYEAYRSAVPEDKNAKIWIADVQKRLGK